AAEGRVGVGAEPAGEVGVLKADAFRRGGGRDGGADPGDGAAVGGGAVEGDDLADGAGALVPEGAGELAGATAEVEPALAGAWVEPGGRVAEQLAVGGQLALGPERPGAALVVPVIDVGRGGRGHGNPFR